MAEEKVKILNIDTSKAQVSIKDLKEQIKGYKKDLEEAAVGSEEASKASKKLADAQIALTAAQKGAIEATGHLDNSYNGLVQQMAKLKVEQKQIDLSTKDGQKSFEEYANKINGINDKLKSLDAQNGVFTRNVGNYTSALENLGGKASGAVVSGLNQMKTAMTALGASAGWITAVVILVKQLADAFQRNTEAMDSLHKIMIPFQALWLQIQRLFDDVVKLFVDLTNGAGSFGEILKTMMKVSLVPLNALIAAIRVNFLLWGNGIKVIENLLNAIITPIKNVTKSLGEMSGLTKVFDKIKTAFNDMIDSLAEAWNWLAKSKLGELLNLEEIAGSIKEIVSGNEELITTNQEILDIEKRLRKAKEEDTKLLGDEAVKLTELRDQYNSMAEDDKRRLGIAKQISDIEHAQKQRAYDMAVQEYELIKKRNSLTNSNADDIQAEADAYKNMKDALAALNTKSSEYYKQVRKDQKEAATEAKAEATEVEKLIKSLNDWAAKNSDNLVMSEGALKVKFDKELAMLEGNEEAKKILTQKYEKELKDLRTKNAKDSLTELNNIYATTRSDLENKYTEAKIEIERLYGTDSLEKQKALKEAEMQMLNDRLDAQNSYMEQLKAQRDLMVEQGLETVEIEKQIAAQAKAINDTILEVEIQQNEAQDAMIQQKVASITSSLDMMGQFAAEMASIGNGISSQWANVFGSVADGIEQVSAVIKEKGAGSWEAYAQMASMACGVASKVFSALADEQDEQTEEGFEKQKKFQIAAATMSMLGGVISAWTSAMNPANAWMTVWGQIAMGAAMTAMILGTGIAQIANIKKQKMNGSSSSGGSSGGSVPRVEGGSIGDSPITYTDVVNTDEVGDSVGSQRVYVVESDITDSQRRVNVAESEAGF